MKKKKFFVSLISTLLFLIFLSIMDYPFLARMFNERNQGAVVVDYEETLGKRSDPEKERMLEEARKYNSSLASGLGNALGNSEKKSGRAASGSDLSWTALGSGRRSDRED